MASTPAPGEPAPDFTLPGVALGEEPRDFTLSEQRGRPVVLAFYPGDETPVCTRQLCSYQHDLDVLRGLDATLWGISSQTIDSHQRFQAHRGLTFPLLADVRNVAFNAYGLGSLLNRRALFVIDAGGRVAWRHVSTMGLSYQKVDRIAEVLRSLPVAYPAGTDVTATTAKPSGADKSARARKTTR